MSKWKRKPSAQKGTYFFSGKFLVTNGVQTLLTPEEILGIYQEVKQLVKEESGLDYLQVYIHEDTKQKLFFIDQLNKEMIESGAYEPEHNHCTLLRAEEH